MVMEKGYYFDCNTRVLLQIKTLKRTKNNWKSHQSSVLVLYLSI